MPYKNSLNISKNKHLGHLDLYIIVKNRQQVNQKNLTKTPIWW
jgi:hypothetical protein